MATIYIRRSQVNWIWDRGTPGVCRFPESSLLVWVQHSLFPACLGDWILCHHAAVFSELLHYTTVRQCPIFNVVILKLPSWRSRSVHLQRVKCSAVVPGNLKTGNSKLLRPSFLQLYAITKVVTRYKSGWCYKSGCTNWIRSFLREMRPSTKSKMWYLTSAIYFFLTLRWIGINCNLG